MSWRNSILVGDVRERLAEIPDGSVQCVVTSPPYWGLRDYGTDGQIGLEPTPEAYVCGMVEVFREVRRVLRDDGTVFLNLGDSYASNPRGNAPGEFSTSSLTNPARQDGMRRGNPNKNGGHSNRDGAYIPPGLKAKDLVGIPWRVAFALQADGWVLRSEIIWAKPNPMPESVTDRPTKAHEQLFLFSKAKWSGPEPGRFAHISAADAQWIAGLIDCEGSIVIKRVKQIDGGCDAYAPQVSIGSTSRALLERVVAITGHGNILGRPGKNAPMHYWQVAHSIARDFLLAIYPYLIIKQRQARIGIHVDSLTYYRGGQTATRKMRTGKEESELESLWARNKELNHFGDPDMSDVPEPVYGAWRGTERYYYDHEAIREPLAESSIQRINQPNFANQTGGPKDYALTGEGIHSQRRTLENFAAANKAPVTPGYFNFRRETKEADVPGQTMRQHREERADSPMPNGRNKRTVWEVPTMPYAEAHFATYPPELIKPCILAGSSEHGCCSECGAPWQRVTEKEYPPTTRTPAPNKGHLGAFGERAANMTRDGFVPNRVADIRTTGWEPTCKHEAPIARSVILDPFMGSGTTALVALKAGRDFVGVELNPTYAEMAERRIAPFMSRLL